MSSRVDSFEIPGWDEDGFHLTIGTDDEGRLELRVTDTEVARQLIEQVDGGLEALRDWVAEHDHQHAAYLVASPAERARVMGRALELDLGDPDAFDERAEALRDRADHERKVGRES